MFMGCSPRNRSLPPRPLNKNRHFLDFRKSIVTKQTGRSCTPAVTIPSAIVAEAAAEIQNRHAPASLGDLAGEVFRRRPGILRRI